MIVNKATTEIICTNCRNGKCHDYRLFKESVEKEWLFEFAKDCIQGDDHRFSYCQVVVLLQP